MDINKIMEWYVALLIIGFLLFLYFSNKNLKEELSRMEKSKEFFRELLCAYMDKYGKDLWNERVEDMLNKAGITDEHPLRVKIRQ